MRPNRLPLLVLGSALLSLAACGGAQSRKARHMAKGQTFLAAGNYEKARVEFQNALQIAPTDAEARFENGVVDEKLNKIRDAAQFYQGALNVDPEHLGARINLARLYVFSGAAAQALDLLAPAVEKHPDDAELLTVRAAARQQQKDAAGAMADAERAVQLAPANEDAVAVLSGLYLSSGNPGKAQALLEQSIQRIPATVDLRLALAQIYSQADRPSDTEELLTKIVALRPSNKADRLRLAQFYVHLDQIDPAENTLRQAIKALPGELDLKLALIDFLAVHRDRAAAEKELQRFIAAQPDDSELKFALARFYEGGKEASKAEGVYRKMIAANKLNAAGLSARDKLASLLAQRDDVPAALALIGEVLAKSPRDDDALLLRGDIALAKQDPRAAIADLRAVLRDQPNAVGVLRTLARAHLANGEPAVAEETMRRALDVNPKDPAVQLDFAELMIRLNKPDQAKPILAELVKQQPDNLAVLDAQFRVAMMIQDLATARAAAEAVIAIRPKAAAGYYYEGMVAEASSRGEEALRLYAQAVDLEPNSLEPMQAQTRLLLALKRGDEAFKRADDLTQRYPHSALGPEAKGEMLLAKGRNAEAQAAFNEAITRMPKWWVPYRGLASVQLAEENPDGAIETLTRAKTLVQQPEKIEIQLAALLESRGMPEKAISEYDAILARDPLSELAVNNLAMALATYKKDKVSLDRARDLSSRFADSANPSFLDTYGWVLYKRGETSASVPVFERVVAKLPNEPVVRYHLGMAQYQLGSSSAARDNLTRAVNSGAKFAGLDEAKAMLAKIAKLPDSGSAAPKT